MALSDPSIQGTAIERLEGSNAAARKLPVPLEVKIAGRNLKITDYNELFDLNKINGNSRRITTLTIKTVSTYKQKLDPTSKSEQAPTTAQSLNGNQQYSSAQEGNTSFRKLERSNKDLQFKSETCAPSKLNNQNNKLSDKENHQVLKSDELIRTKSDLEQRKIKQITIEKSIQIDPRTKLTVNDDHQLNNRTYGVKPDDNFFRNSKRSSSLRQINQFTNKYANNADLKPTDSSNTKYFVSNKFDTNTPVMSERALSKSDQQKSKLFYFNGTNNQMLYKDEIDNLSSNLNSQKLQQSNAGAIDEKFKRHLNASLNSSLNSNHNAKDGNNNSSLNSRANYAAGLATVRQPQYGQSSNSQINNSQINPQSHLAYAHQQQAKQQSNQLNQSYLEQYHHQQQQQHPNNQQVNNSFMRKKQPANRKLSAGGTNVDEINCDEFVSELKTKIANNNQTTSSPATAAKLNNLNSNSLGKERTRQHLILDTSTMPHLNRNKQQANNYLNNFNNATQPQSRPLLTSSIRRNESFQKATEHRIRMEPVRRSTRSLNKDAQQSSKQQLNTEMGPTDKPDHSQQLMINNNNNNSRSVQRFSYLGSQAVNGYQPENFNRQSNDNLANETCTTDDWNTTLDTNAETRSSTDDRSRQFKKCDKYGFFINEEEEQKKSSKTASIKKEDEQAKKTNLEIDKRREMKWLEMLNNWDRYMQKRWGKICQRCRKGIPPSLRGKAWFYLCAAHKQRRLKPELFQILCQEPGDESINDEIIKDLHRQFPNHEMFAGASGNTGGQQDLFIILKNFSILKPDIAYCQGEAPIASVLLMHMPVEEAFYALVQLCDHFLNGYFTPGLETIQMHGRMLTSLLKRHNNFVYKCLKKQKIDSTMYMTEWYMCVFSRTLPWPTVLRVWDMFFCEGIKIVFRVALVILNSIEPELKKAKCNSNDKLAETMEILKNLPKKYLEVDYLLPKVIEMGLNEKDLEQEHYNVLKEMKKKAKKKK